MLAGSGPQGAAEPPTCCHVEVSGLPDQHEALKGYQLSLLCYSIQTKEAVATRSERPEQDSS